MLTNKNILSKLFFLILISFVCIYTITIFAKEEKVKKFEGLTKEEYSTIINKEISDSEWAKITDNGKRVVIGGSDSETNIKLKEKMDSN